jgi:PAS domain S-box-containing protein
VERKVSFHTVITQTRMITAVGSGVALGLLLFVIAYSIAQREWRDEDARESKSFWSVSETVARAIAVKLNTRLSGLQALHEDLQSGLAVFGESFEKAAALVNRSSGGYLAINLIDADRRIVQVWPLQPNRDALGRIVGQSAAVVQLLEDAVATNEPKATGIVDLFQGGQGIAVYFPLTREGRHTGFLNAIFRLGDLDTDLLEIVPIGFRLTLDTKPSAADRIRTVQMSNQMFHVAFDQRVLNQTFYINLEQRRDAPTTASRVASLSWKIMLSVFCAVILSGYLIWIKKSRAEEALLASILRSSPVAFVSVDSQGKIIKFNPAAETMFGYASSQMLNRKIDILVPSGARAKHAGLVIKFFRSSIEHQYMGDWRSIEAQRADGSRFNVSVLLTKSIVDGDRITTAMLTDMTGEQTRQRELLRLIEEREIAAERAEAANKAKTIFLASMSHELRTPLNAIIGFSDLINQQIFGPVQPAKYREYLHDIHDSAQGLLSLINDILDYSKIETGALVISKEAFDVNDVVEHAIRTATGVAIEKGLKLDLDTRTSIPKVYGDSRAARQVLLNLLSNAIKFSPRDSVISIRRSVNTGANELFVEISDSGPGISKRDLAHLGTPFYQARNNSFISSEGTGLGLAICSGLMKAMEGRIEIDSEVGKGTTVRAVFIAAKDDTLI